MNAYQSNIAARKFNTKTITLIGVLSGITMMLGLTPLGFLPIGPTNATIMHIPVIIGGIIGGPLVGASVGLMFGLSSLLNAVMKPTAVSFAFLNPLVSVLPRILIGLGSAYIYKSLSKLGKEKVRALMLLIWSAISVYLSYGFYKAITEANTFSIIINAVLLGITLTSAVLTFKKGSSASFDVVFTAAAGTLINTVLVLTSIYFLYGTIFVEKLGKDTAMVGKAILTIGIVNGIPEIIVAVVLVSGIIRALVKNKS